MNGWIDVKNLKNCQIYLNNSYASCEDKLGKVVAKLTKIRKLKFVSFYILLYF